MIPDISWIWGLFAWIHWPSFVLGIGTLIGLQIGAVIFLWKRYVKVANDPEGDKKRIDNLIEEYDNHAKGS